MQEHHSREDWPTYCERHDTARFECGIPCGVRRRCIIVHEHVRRGALEHHEPLLPQRRQP